MSRVAVIHTGLSNVDSVVRAIEEVGAHPFLVRDVGDMGTPDHVVLPGVGSFAAGVEALRAGRLDDAIHEQVSSGIPLLGICLGMQMLLTTGQEGGACSGLDLIGGDVQPLDGRAGERVPHVGWNELDLTRRSPLLEGIQGGTDFYFVHSYRVVPDNPEHVVASTPYGGGFTSVVEDGAVFGVQFHPEKSHRAGLRLLQNFVEL